VKADEAYSVFLVAVGAYNQAAPTTHLQTVKFHTTLCFNSLNLLYAFKRRAKKINTTFDEFVFRQDSFELQFI